MLHLTGTLTAIRPSFHNFLINSPSTAALPDLFIPLPIPPAPQIEDLLSHVLQKKLKTLILSSPFTSLLLHILLLRCFLPHLLHMVRCLYSSPRPIPQFVQAIPFLLSSLLSPLCLLFSVPLWLLLSFFPIAFKHSLVSPVLKKPPLDPFITPNCLPISLLFFLAKFLENAVYNR